MNTIDKEKAISNKIDKEEILLLYNLLELISKHLYTKKEEIEIWKYITVSLEEDSYNAYENTETTSDAEEELMPLFLQRNRTVKSGSWAIIIQDWDKIDKKISYHISLNKLEATPSIRLYLQEMKKDEDNEEYYHTIDNLSNRASENNSQKDSFVIFKKIINGIASHILIESELQSQKVVSSKTTKDNINLMKANIIEVLSADNSMNNRIDLL